MGCVFSFFSPGGPYNLGWFKKAQRSEEQEAESGSTGDSNSVNASKLKQFDEESALLDAEAPVPISKPLEPEDKAEEPEEVVVIPTAAAPSPQSEQSITTEVTQKENSSEVDLPLKVAAVTKLQAGYRGYKTRKDLKQRKQQQREPLKVETDEKNEPCLDIPTTTEEDSVPEEIETATKLQADVSGFQTNTNLEEEQLDKNVGDDVVDDDAVEKQEGNEADVISTEENAVSENSTPPVEERSLQEVAAAVTLQAGFRGYQTRKNLKVQKQQNKKEEEDQAQLSTSRPENDSLNSSVINETGPSITFQNLSNIPENGPLEEASTTIQSEFSESPFPKSDADETMDEEIAAEIKTPLETIREESFDHSISSSHAIPPSSLTTKEVEYTETEKVKEGEELVSSSEKSSKDDRINLMKVAFISTEEVSAALGDLLGDTEEEEESQSGIDPSLKENGVTKETTKSDADDDSNNNDTDNKNDELKSSSADDLKVGKDVLAHVQICDHQLDQIEEISEKANNIVKTSNDGDIIPHPENFKQEFSVVDHNEEDPVEVIDENIENVLKVNDEGVESKKAEEIVLEEPHEGINLSFSTNGKIADDQTDLAGKEDEESGGGNDDVVVGGAVIVDDDVDKSKRSDSPKPVDDVNDHESCGTENVEIEREINAEENTPNITNNVEEFSAVQQQQEVGQKAHDNDDEIVDFYGDDHDQINREREEDAEEKSESIQLQHSNASALTDSSVDCLDREDTDIATPTDFSNHEDKDSLNLEELRKFASKFEEEMEPTVVNAEEGATAGGTPAPEAKAEEKPATATEVPSSSPDTTTSSEKSENIMQVEVKASESPAPAPPSATEEKVAEAPTVTPENKPEAGNENSSATAEPIKAEDTAKPSEEVKVSEQTVAPSQVPPETSEIKAETPVQSNEAPVQVAPEGPSQPQDNTDAKVPEPAQQLAETVTPVVPEVSPTETSEAKPTEKTEQAPEAPAQSPVCEETKATEQAASETPVTVENKASEEPKQSEVAADATPKIEDPATPQQTNTAEEPKPTSTEPTEVKAVESENQSESPKPASESTPETTSSTAAAPENSAIQTPTVEGEPVSPSVPPATESQPSTETQPKTEPENASPAPENKSSTEATPTPTAELPKDVQPEIVKADSASEPLSDKPAEQVPPASQEKQDPSDAAQAASESPQPLASQQPVSEEPKKTEEITAAVESSSPPQPTETAVPSSDPPAAPVPPVNPENPPAASSDSTLPSATNNEADQVKTEAPSQVASPPNTAEVPSSQPEQVPNNNDSKDGNISPQAAPTTDDSQSQPPLSSSDTPIPAETPASKSTDAANAVVASNVDAPTENTNNLS